MKEKPITDLCRGEPCYVRLPDLCNSSPENSAPAHLRLAGITGMGYIAPAFMACPSCPNCHDAYDRRRFLDLDRDYVELNFLRGLMRWQNLLADKGVLVVIP